MKCSFFIVTWGGSNNKFVGPFETMEIAQKNLRQQVDSDLEVTMYQIVALPVFESGLLLRPDGTDEVRQDIEYQIPPDDRELHFEPVVLSFLR